MSLLLVSEAAAVLRLPPVADPSRWLRRHLREVERRTGAQLLIPTRNGRRRPTYRVDLEEVRRACPELFSTMGQLARALEGCAVVPAPELREMTRRHRDLAEMVEDLADHIRSLERRLAGRGVAGGRRSRR